MEFLLSVPYLGATLKYVVPFLVLLTLVVAVHEFGHYLVARWCGVVSTVFSVGFGRELVGWTDRHGTRWRFSLIPLGGYVRFLGDQDAASVASDEDAAETQGTMAAAPLWRRAAIVFAGPAANFLFCGALLFGLALVEGHPVLEPQVNVVRSERGLDALGLERGDVILEVNGRPVWLYGEAIQAILTSDRERIDLLVERGGNRVRTGGVLLQEPRVESVVRGSAAAEAGFMADDLVLLVDGAPVDDFGGVQRLVRESGGALMAFTVQRGDGEVELRVRPRWQEGTDPVSGLAARTPVLGITGSVQLPFSSGMESAGFIEALKYGVVQTYEVLFISLRTVGDMATGQASFDNVGGPIAIASFTGEAAERGLYEFMFLLALISASIGLINLFPIPVLDGGHLLLFALEAIRGRPLGERATQTLFRFGIVLLIGLMALVTFNDIVNL